MYSLTSIQVPDFTINLSKLDFKFFMGILHCAKMSTINLSKLDFKSKITLINSQYINDYKSIQTGF